MEKIVITSGVRTAIGAFGGSLKDIPLSQLAAIVTKEAILRSKLEVTEIDEVVFGSVGQIGESAYLARMAAIQAGLPVETTALTVNRLCASGLQSIISGTQSIQTGMSNIVVSGGAENMSQLPFLDYERRWGRKMGEVTVRDALTEILSDPFEKYAMGVTAENVAAKYNISRDEQDEYAYQSQHKATQAIENGAFKNQIVSIQVPIGREKYQQFDTDEYPKNATSLEKLSKLRPVFRKDGSVTAGNSSGINDAASALVLMKESEAIQRGIKPMVSIKSYAFSGVEPSIMGIGPVPAVKKALEKAGLSLDDIGLIESNEAFAAQCLAVSKTLNFNDDIVNVNGGAIALGHPVGATGNILAVKIMYEMEQRNTRYGLVTLCIGGGQGCAVIFEKYQ
ncbi:thiolase family protein [Bacillus sp. JJ1533]|uniref:thiolase family protein n=1 Tax=Bacillus sp. JJ1533 TaxID=3122959 RepID=UPI002FFF1C6C